MQPFTHKFNNALYFGFPVSSAGSCADVLLSVPSSISETQTMCVGGLW